MKKNIFKHLTALLLMVSFALCVMPAAYADVNDMRDELVGEWTGSYNNNAGINGLRFSVFKENDDYRALVRFYPIEGSPSSQRAGSYFADVRINDSTGQINIVGTTWIEQPSGWTFAHFYGTVSANEFSGTTNIANNSFNVTRSEFTPNTDIRLRELIGEWTGTYTNNHGINGLRLTVFEEGLTIRAIFSFYPAPNSSSNQRAGSYLTYVMYNESSDSIEIIGTTWIDRPGNWIFSNLSGSINGDIFSGVSSGSSSGSGPFSLTRNTAAQTVNRDEIGVYLNNARIDFDQPPIIENGRTLVPIRAIAEAMGATVNWDAETQTATITGANMVVGLTIDSTDMAVNGNIVTLDVAATSYNGRILIPVRAISEAFGAAVEWRADENAVYIVY